MEFHFSFLNLINFFGRQELFVFLDVLQFELVGCDSGFDYVFHDFGIFGFRGIGIFSLAHFLPGFLVLFLFFVLQFKVKREELGCFLGIQSGLFCDESLLAVPELLFAELDFLCLSGSRLPAG